MITEDYVSFEIAKLLKEKGFDERVLSFYTESGLEGYMFALKTTNNTDLDSGFISRPTLQMAMKWLREKHNLHITVYPYGEYSCNNYQFDVYKNNNLVVSKDDGYITYEQACEVAIKYCLENLIEYAQDKVEDITEMCADEPFAIVTNTKTGKWFRAKKCSEPIRRHTNLSVDITFRVTPNDIKDTIPVIGTYRLADGMTKKEFVGNNAEIHVEIFNKYKIKQDEYFLYNVWISGIVSETNEIVLSCDWMK